MSTQTLIEVDQLIDNLRLLCTQPSTSGNIHELEATVRVVADMVRRAGLDVMTVRTRGAPVVIGWCAGRKPYTMLLYHHYDVAPTGPWRTWLHEPFQVAERENCLYGRGVAHGKGPLVAHLQAIQSLLRVEGELPHGIVIIIEGEKLLGSPHLARVVRRYTDKGDIHACLSSGGERDTAGRPFCYSGSKGLLQLRLTAKGASLPLSSCFGASVPNPVWRLIWALSAIKGADEDIRINGFYETVEGPGRKERLLLREIELDESGRMEAWNIPEFLFGMSGSTLLRTEVTLPTCNVTSFNVETSSDMPCIPTMASARLDFHLVPQQQPDIILNLLRKHLVERGFKDVIIEKLPGCYAPVAGKIDEPFLQQIAYTGKQVYGEPLTVLPFGLFTQPLHTFANYLEIPVATLAIARHNSAEFGANENLPIDDLVNHAHMLLEIMIQGSELAREVAMLHM